MVLIIELEEKVEMKNKALKKKTLARSTTVKDGVLVAIDRQKSTN